MHIRSALLTGAVFCGFILSAPALAQGADAATQKSTATSAQTGSEIETVMVTARMWSESIQNSPVSVTAIDSEQIAKLFVHDLSDLNHSAPNFSIEGVGAIHRNAGVIYSRGVGYSGVSMGQDPSVGVSVNGVFFSHNVGVLSNMLDVEQVEILRGPQGTLWGKNTIGGVVNITTKKPGDVYALQGMVRVGNLGRQDYFGAVDLPLDDTLAVRISFQSQYSDGPFKNAYVPPPGSPKVDKYLGGDNIKTLRGTVVWKPISELEFDLVGTFSRDRSPSVGGQNGSTPTDALTFFGHPGYDYRTPGLPYPLGPNDPYTVYRNFPSGDYQDTAFVSLNGRYHAPWFDVVSVTGYMNEWNRSLSDYDDTELNFFQSDYVLHSHQVSQELRLESNDASSPLRWVLGGIYTTRTWDGQQLFYSMFPSLDNHIDFARQNDDAFAVFGQASYAITKKLEITGGLRYTTETKDIYRIASHLATLPDPAPFIHKKTWSNLTYLASINYHIDENKMVYASYSTGFVAGGFNTRVDTDALTGKPYAPEKAKAIEIGAKTDWFHHRLRANLAAFWNKYDDLQVGAFIPGGGLQQAIVNNAFERANGVELEITALPIDKLLVSLSVGWLDAKYTSFFADLKNLGSPQDNAGLRPYRSPKWTTRLEASYDFDLNGHGTLTPDISWSYRTSYMTDLTNSPVGYQKAYSMVDGSLTYAEPNSRWRIALWAKNITNTLYRLSAVPSSGYFTQLYFANPRTFGVDLTFKLESE